MHNASQMCQCDTPASAHGANLPRRATAAAAFVSHFVLVIIYDAHACPRSPPFADKAHRLVGWHVCLGHLFTWPWLTRHRIFTFQNPAPKFVER